MLAGLGGVACRESEREKEHTHAREREREKHTQWEREKERLSPPFICFLLPGPALCKFGSARSALLPEVFTLVLRPFFDLLLFYFRAPFPSLSFSHCHFRLLFPILPTYNFYNKQVSSK